MLSTSTVTEQGAQTAPAPWTPLQRWAFRVTLVYFVLDALPDLLLWMPGGEVVLRWYGAPWNVVLPWFGAHVLHARDSQSLALPTVPVLLGDFPGAYVLMLVFFLVAVTVASIWAFVDRGRTDDHALHGWLRVYVRYALAFSMLGYGLSKLFHVQFRELDLLDSLTPLGSLQPRELLWDFMGFSRTYQVFTGVVECLGVAFVLFRRTTLLGALLLAAAMTNVFVMDIAYGVSVSRIALRLLLLSAFLVAPELRRLLNVFALDRPAGAANVDGPRWQGRVTRGTARVLKAIVIVGVVTAQSRHYLHERMLVVVPRPALYGVFSVERAVHDGRDEVPNDPRRWTWIAIDGRGVAIARADATFDRRRATFDAAHQTIAFAGGGQAKDLLPYTADGERVTMAGTLDHRPTTLVLRRLAIPGLPLLNPGGSR